MPLCQQNWWYGWFQISSVVFHPIWDQLGQSQSHHKKTRLRVTFGSIVLVIAQLGPELGGAWCMKGSPLANVHGKHQTPPKKKKNVFPISIFWSHRLKFWPNWSVSAASQSHGEAPWPRHLLSMLPYAVCKGSSTCSWDAKIGAAGVLCCRIRARSAVGLGGLVASWHRFTVGRIGRPVGCSKGMFEGVKQIDPWFIHLELGSIRMWSGCDSHSNGVPCLLVFRVSCWLHHLVDCCSPFFNWCLIVIWVIIIPIVSWQHAHITSNCAPKNCHLESKSPIPKLSDLYSGKVLTYTPLVI